MIRFLTHTLALSLFLAGPSAAEESEYEKLNADPAIAKEFKDVDKILKDYFKAEGIIEDGGRNASKYYSVRDEAIQKFMVWLNGSEQSVGVDLRGKPQVVVEIFDRARLDQMVKPRSGKIDYIRKDDPRGMERFEYSLLAPQGYGKMLKDDQRLPLVVSLHERVIGDKHPAFRGAKDATERSRVTIYNNWFKTPAADEVVVIAPTTDANGFKFVPRTFYQDLQLTMVAMGQAFTDYRIDWNKVFLEMHGQALRIACAQAPMFAGFILRDREDEKTLQIDTDHLFMLENLNGIPFLYVADTGTWDNIGKPLSEALTAAYKKAGKPENLVIIKDTRDANGALKGDKEAIAAFLRKHRRPVALKKFTWRYFDSGMANPFPLQVDQAEYNYEDLALEKVAGAIDFEARLEKDGASFVNVIDIKITEAEALSVHLYDGLVDLAFPVTVIINGKTIHDKVKVKRDWGLFRDLLLPRRFFMIPVVATLQCTFEHKPQYEKKAEAGAANAGAEKPKDAAATKGQ